MSEGERASKEDLEAPGAVAAGDAESAADIPEQQPPEDPEVLRAQIDETRAELGDTVEALSAKADVKGQVKEKVEERKERLREQQAQAEARLGELSDRAKQNPAPFAAAAGGALLLLLLVRRSRRRR